MSELTDIRSKCTIQRRGKFQYDVCYQPITKGKHHLHIKVLGQYIRGSPFSVAVKSVEKLKCTSILTIDKFKNPWGVAINHQSGEVIVAEADCHCVSVLSPSGKKYRSFGTEGTDQGQFKSPRGVAVDSHGNILVADYGNHRIQKFTKDGQLLAAVGTEGSGPLQFNLPEGIAINTQNRKVYVIDKNRIQVLNSDLTFSNNLEGVFNCIDCDSSGNIWVASSDRIQVFTPTGNYLRSHFNPIVTVHYGFRQIFSIGSDIDGKVYIISNFKGNIYGDYSIYVHVFTTGGQQVSSSKLGPLNSTHTPHGIAIDNNGVVYMSNNNQLQVL